MDENKIKEALSETYKSEVPDTWNQIEAKVNQNDIEAMPMQRKSKRKIVASRIAIAAAFFLIIGGIGLYDNLFKSNDSKDNRGFSLEAYADSNTAPTEIKKGEDSIVSIAGSGVSLTYDENDENAQPMTTEYTIFLKAGGKDYKSHEVKSVKNGSLANPQLGGINEDYVLEVNSDYAIEDEGPVDSGQNNINEELDPDTFVIASDGTKTVKVTLEVTFSDGKTEEYTLTLTPKESTDLDAQAGIDGVTTDIKMIEYEITLD